jgi:DNA-binding NarL/FixJ family response regulator
MPAPLFPSPYSPPAKEIQRLRILIAHDHELVRRGLRVLLGAQRGWKVTSEAVNGREAVEKTKELKPDIAILDIGLPDVDGLEAARQITQAAPDANVLILTTDESDQMVRRILQAGARGYVLKSELPEQLVKAVKTASQSKVFLTPKVSEIVLEAFLNQPKTLKPGERSRSQPTPRETEIIQLLAEGKATKEISTALGIAVRTVETHRAKIRLKLGLHSVAELVKYASRYKLIEKQES